MVSLTGKQELINLVAPKNIKSENTKPEALTTLIYLDPVLQLYNYQEIQLLENNLFGIKKTELFYFNKDKIHNNLYQEEQFIDIDSYENSKSLTFCFYLSILINDKKAYINYKHNISYINEIFEIMEKSENKFKKKLYSKFLIDIIYNYKGIEQYNEKEEKELNEKLTVCENNIKNKDIENIYIDIIVWLLKNNNLENYENVYNIIKEVELESIDITKKMINDLVIFFNENEENLRDYDIFETEDLLNIKKINFYYILFKFILKNQIYIYQIPLLIKIKNRIITFIKSNYNISSQINKINDSIKKEKIEFVLNFFLDLYYYKRFTIAEKKKVVLLRKLMMKIVKKKIHYLSI